MKPANDTIKERPILFSAPMVRALLAGRKSQTRRMVKPALADPLLRLCGRSDPAQPLRELTGQEFCDGKFHVWSRTRPHCDLLFRCPYGQPGDRLWVKETWRMKLSPGTQRTDDADDGASGRDGEDRIDTCPEIQYRAQGDSDPGPWKSALFMPRTASRISLEILAIRIERLQEISQTDAFAEGIRLPQPDLIYGTKTVLPSCLNADDQDAARGMYRALWENINGRHSWDANPLVWVIEFRHLN